VKLNVTLLGNTCLSGTTDIKQTRVGVIRLSERTSGYLGGIRFLFT